MSDEFTLPVPGIPFTQGGPRGVFGAHPGMTPKYAKNVGEREGDHKETLARLFMEVGDRERDRFLTSIPAESQDLAKALTGTGYIDFLLQQAPIALQEKMSVSETLADSYVAHAFGQHAPSFSYSGTLFNTRQDDQAANMLRMYRDIIRASQLARRQKVVRLRYDSYIVTGVAVSITMNLAAEMEMAVPFTLTMLVKNLTQLINPDSIISVVDEPFGPALYAPKLVTGGAAGPVRVRAAPPMERPAPVVTSVKEDTIEDVETREAKRVLSFWDRAIRGVATADYIP